MIDKQFIKLLNTLIELCDYNSYKVLELAEICNKAKISQEELNAKLTYLHDNEIVDVKYNDGVEVCLSVFKRAKGLVEHDKLPKVRSGLSKSTIIAIMFGALLCGFIGGLLGALIV